MIEDTSAEGWKIESLEPRRFELRPDFNGMTFSNGGPKVWFMVAKREPA